MYFPIRTILALLFFLAAIILLQITLSKRESKWLGLIIPIVSFGFSILWVLGIPYYLSSSGLAFKVILVFIIANIPTAIFLAIYFICREKVNKISEIDKMNIQDLD